MKNTKPLIIVTIVPAIIVKWKPMSSTHDKTCLLGLFSITAMLLFICPNGQYGIDCPKSTV